MKFRTKIDRHTVLISHDLFGHFVRNFTALFYDVKTACQSIFTIFGDIFLYLPEVQIKFIQTSNLTIQTNLNSKQTEQHNLQIQTKLNSKRIEQHIISYNEP